jgi:hypothetical protein
MPTNVVIPINAQTQTHTHTQFVIVASLQHHTIFSFRFFGENACDNCRLECVGKISQYVCDNIGIYVLSVVVVHRFAGVLSKGKSPIRQSQNDHK